MSIEYRGIVRLEPTQPDISTMHIAKLATDSLGD